MLVDAELSPNAAGDVITLQKGIPNNLVRCNSVHYNTLRKLLAYGTVRSMRQFGELLSSPPTICNLRRRGCSYSDAH